jgi:hypothetical protein
VWPTGSRNLLNLARGDFAFFLSETGRRLIFSVSRLAGFGVLALPCKAGSGCHEALNYGFSLQKLRIKNLK